MGHVWLQDMSQVLINNEKNTFLNNTFNNLFVFAIVTVCHILLLGA